jgi:hypothetical protein
VKAQPVTADVSTARYFALPPGSIVAVDRGYYYDFELFDGTSPNALKTQIWTALIAVLLLKYFQFRSARNLTLCRLVSLLHMNLFSYHNLWDWLDDPFDTPPELPDPQLKLMI